MRKTCLLTSCILVTAAACGDSSTSTDPGGSSSSSSSSSGSSGKDGGTGKAPGVTVSSPSKTTTSEDGDSATFTLVLDSEPKAEVSMALSVDKTGEASLDKAKVTFTSSNWNQPQTIAIKGLDDEIDDGDINYGVTIAGATSTDAAYSGKFGTTIALKNIDNDSAGIATSAAAPTAKTTEKGGKITFTVRLRSKPAADVTVPVVSGTPAEGTVDKGSLTFTADNYKTEQTVTVTGINDNLPDTDAAYSINLGASTSTDASYTGLTAKVDLMNVDDDLPVSIAANYQHMCLSFIDGRIKCWGYNGTGGLGYGDIMQRGSAAGQMGDALPFVNLGTDRTVKSLAKVGRSDQFECVILDNDKVKCWGYNGLGQLGYGDTANRGNAAAQMGDVLPYVDLGTGRTAKMIATGYVHTCAILDNDKVKCWGYNGSGQLGYGDTTQRGSAAAQMGDALPYVDLGTGRTAKSIVASADQHTCAILDNDTVKCWGANGNGQLGQGDLNNRGDSASEMGDALLPVNLGTGRTAKSIGAGYLHSCALLDNNTVKCWGGNNFGQLGQGDTTIRGNGAAQMGDTLLAVNLGTGRTAKSLSVGYGQNCAILDNDQLKCWGWNTVGELGYGDLNNRGDQASEMGDLLLAIDVGTGRTARSIWSGTIHTCAILDNYAVKCWGYNTTGQLGQGSTTQLGDNANEMGDALLPIKLIGP